LFDSLLVNVLVKASEGGGRFLMKHGAEILKSVALQFHQQGQRGDDECNLVII
jgi:hypothetical protein